MQENLIDDRGGAIAFSRGGLRQGQVNNNGAWNYNRFQTLNNINFAIDGIFGTLAPTDNIAFSACHPTIIGCNQLFYAIWVNNTNSISTTAGPLSDPAQLAGAGGFGTSAMRFPLLVANNALIGLIKVKVGVGAQFTPGTTNLNATNITATFYDTSVMPVAKHQS